MSSKLNRGTIGSSIVVAKLSKAIVEVFTGFSAVVVKDGFLGVTSGNFLTYDDASYVLYDDGSNVLTI